MTPTELLEYINSEKGLSGKLQEFEQKQKRYKKYKKRKGIGEDIEEYLVEFWDGYKEAVSKYHLNLLHSRGDFPDYLFNVLSPMQDEMELRYLRETYQPITKNVFLEFSNTAKKAVQNGNIDFKDTDSDEDENPLQSYIYNDIKDFNSITEWASAMLDQKLIDGNGIFAVWPYYDVDEDGTIVGETYPQPIIYNVNEVVWKKKGEFIVIDHTSEKYGVVLRYFGKEYVAEYRQVGEMADYQFDIYREFEHEIGYTPAQEMKGIAVIEKQRVMYDSVFGTSVPYLNLAVIDSVTLLAIKKKVGYPTRVVMREKCQYQEGQSSCENGLLKIYTGDDITQKECPNCRGTGYIGVFGPLSELAINSERTIGEEGANVNASNAMSYVSPPTDIPMFLRKEVQYSLDNAMQVLHLKSEPRGSGDISATEKNRDKENTEAFIKPISDQLWDIVGYVIECISVMRFGKAESEELMPRIIRPQSFDLLGAEDYIRELAEAKESGAPEVVIQNIVYKYMSVIHHDDTVSMRVFQLIEKSDRLLTMSSEQVAIGLSRGTVQLWEAVLHQSSTYIVSKTIMDYENPSQFWMLDEGEQIDLIQQTARETVPPAPTTELPPAQEPE